MKEEILIVMTVFIILISGCVMYDSLYMYAENGTLDHPYGIKFNYPSEWNLGEIKSPFMMVLYEGENAVPSIDVILGNRKSERMGHISDIEDLKELFNTMELEHSYQKSINVENIAGRDWVIKQTTDKDDGKIDYYFATLCQGHIFAITLYTNSTEGDPSILYPIAESLEC